ncbi:contractile injection system tape measure protein [uncultured Draconibacterium sp.]|uniref:contractile injection system tape measure protein n=1 Tax=uncultured Draconibacterium sp. TaxID=1573823 RepID=UPI0032163FDF
MNSEQSHIIEKVFLEVTTPGEKEAYWVKNNISSYLNGELLPLLDELFIKYDTNNEIIRFDELNIEVLLKNMEDLPSAKFEVVKSIANQLDNGGIEVNGSVDNLNKASSSKQVVDTETNLQNTFLFFIEKGYLPWFGKQEYIYELSQPKQWITILKKESFFEAIRNVLKQKEDAVERFVFQFSEEQILDFISATNKVQIANKTLLLRFLRESDFPFKIFFLKRLLLLSLGTLKKQSLAELVELYISDRSFEKKTITEVAKTAQLFVSQIRKVFAKETFQNYFLYSKKEIEQIDEFILVQSKTIQSGRRPNEFSNSHTKLKSTFTRKEFVNFDKKKEPPFFENNTSDIVVRKAGLVLFCPFLNAFFKHFNWLEENGSLKPDIIYKAVQTLHYLATGNELFFEGDLILEKFLCGIKLNASIPNKSFIDQEIKTEIENLLYQVIRSWPELKNTGPDGLRQMFVQRDGKLIKKEKGYKLIVEHKVQDVLMEKLQWNFSLIKLPWKDELLFVEW